MPASSNWSRDDYYDVLTYWGFKRLESFDGRYKFPAAGAIKMNQIPEFNSGGTYGQDRARYDVALTILKLVDQSFPNRKFTSGGGPDSTKRALIGAMGKKTNTPNDISTSLSQFIDIGEPAKF